MQLLVERTDLQRVIIHFCVHFFFQVFYLNLKLRNPLFSLRDLFIQVDDLSVLFFEDCLPLHQRLLQPLLCQLLCLVPQLQLMPVPIGLVQLFC